MKICPNDNNHLEFVTVAHVTEDWVVDGNGEFIEVAAHCIEVVAKPDRDNIWTCNTCGVEAVERR